MRLIASDLGSFFPDRRPTLSGVVSIGHDMLPEYLPKLWVGFRYHNFFSGIIRAR